MITKTVFAYDPRSRAYLRAITLDEGDLSPADLSLGRTVWLIPGNCLEAAPPQASSGKCVVEKDGLWVLKDIPPLTTPVVTAPVEPEPRELTLEERAAALEALVVSMLDATARAYRYKSIETAVTYAEEKAVPKFWAEGRMFRAWRSKVYAKCYELLAQVVAGEIEEPTAETLPGMLPVLDAITCAREQAELEAEQAAAAAPEAGPKA